MEKVIVSKSVIEDCLNYLDCLEIIHDNKTGHREISIYKRTSDKIRQQLRAQNIYNLSKPENKLRKNFCVIFNNME